MDQQIRSAMATGSVILFLLLTGCATESAEPAAVESLSLDRSIQSVGEEVLVGLRAQPFCSPTKIRTGVARLTWETDPSLIEKQRIEVTVFKLGFEKGLYGSIRPIKPGDEFEVPDLREPVGGTLEPITRLRLAELVFNREQGEISVDVEALEPGVIYSWRILTTTDEDRIYSETVRVEAPVCVADMIEEE